MSCQYCTDPDGEPCFPSYGLAPHKHIGNAMMGSTVIAPANEWPSNFKEDPDCPGMGVWWCEHCGHGSPDGHCDLGLDCCCGRRANLPESLTCKYWIQGAHSAEGGSDE